MREISSQKFRYAILIALHIMTAIALIYAVGCSSGKTAAITQSGGQTKAPYGRIDIPESYLANGLGELCLQLSQTCGPVNVDLITKTYSPQIRRNLFYHGFCTLQKLNINGSTVDINIFFLPDTQPPTLRMEGYVNGSGQPQAVLSSHYTVSQQ
jgi:hypothetical protein